MCHRAKPDWPHAGHPGATRRQRRRRATPRRRRRRPRRQPTSWDRRPTTTRTWRRRCRWCVITCALTSKIGRGTRSGYVSLLRQAAFMQSYLPLLVKNWKIRLEKCVFATFDAIICASGWFSLRERRPCSKDTFGPEEGVGVYSEEDEIRWSNLCNWGEVWCRWTSFLPLTFQCAGKGTRIPFGGFSQYSALVLCTIIVFMYRGDKFHYVKGWERVLFLILHHSGEKGRKGRECKFQNKAQPLT